MSVEGVLRSERRRQSICVDKDKDKDRTGGKGLSGDGAGSAEEGLGDVPEEAEEDEAPVKDIPVPGTAVTIGMLGYIL